MSSLREKFLLLLWKKFLIYRRHYIRTLVELLLPLVFSSVVLVLPLVPIKDPLFLPFVSQASLDLSSNNLTIFPAGKKFLYFPRNNLTQEILQEATSVLGIDGAAGLSYENELEGLFDTRFVAAGIVFEKFNPKVVSYVLRYRKTSARELLAAQLAISNAIVRRLVPTAVIPPISVRQRERKQIMKIMGFSYGIQRASRFVALVIMFSVSASMILYLLMISMTTHSNWLLVWIFLLVYMVSIVCFCSLISVLFNNGTTAVVMAAIAWFLSGFPAIVNHSFTWKLMVSLLSNSAMIYGLHALLHHESNGVGITWSTCWEGTSPTDRYSFAVSVGMMLLDSLLYMATVLYLEQIRPDAFRVPKPWYFPIQWSFWKRPIHKRRVVSWMEPQKSPYIQQDPSSRKVGIQIHNLHKINQRNLVAIADFTLNLYRDQITVLVGHNGAGKSTLISILSGMVSPSSGTALINGYDIQDATEKAQASLGFCPQHNVLFDELTVSEHLRFAARSKTLSDSSVESRYASLLGLVDELNSRSDTLSGDMKRKLTVGMALCGGSSVVLLDEPTSGVDPATRKAIWDCLLREKTGRTILLSTHSMDEAEALGGRIAIMAGGELTAVGSRSFLKKMFGVGYRLTCAKAADAQAGKLLSVLQTFIGDLEIDAESDSEVSFVLKQETAENFEKILRTLDSQLEACGMTSYRISYVTLEEVFLKTSLESLTTERDHRQSYTTKPELLKGFRLVLSQLWALVLRKWLCISRAWPELAVPTMLPVICLSLLLMAKTKYPSVRFSGVGLENHLDESSVIEEYRSQFPSDQLFNFSDHNLEFGATFTEFEYTAWFNGRNSGLASISLNRIHNAILRSKCSECRLSVYQQTVPSEKSVRRLDPNPFPDISLTVATMFSMSIVAATFIPCYIQERIDQVKLLLRLTRVSCGLYWIANFVFDILLFMVSVVLFVITLIYFDVPDWSDRREIVDLLLIFVMYANAFLPQTYLLSFWIDTPGSGFVCLLMLNLSAGIFIPLALKLVTYFPFEPDRYLRLLPNFVLFGVAIKFDNAARSKELCDVVNPTDFICSGLMSDFSSLLTTGAFCWTLIGCLEQNLHRRLQCPRPVRSIAGNLRGVDSDVLEERRHVSRMTVSEIGQHSVVLKQLSKRYGSVEAVRRLSLALKSGDCFGFLGSNGTGKTTVFKMLVGDESISSGEVWFSGTAGNQFETSIGYCPQFGGLQGYLTGMDHFRVFALLNGIRKADRIETVSGLAEDLSLCKYLNECTLNYNTISKRKLSVALALMGPSIVLLDEPSSCMDPKSSKQLWNVIRNVRDAGKTVILATQRVDEAEALCTKLAFMVGGELKCLGSIQHLSRRFSEGFTIDIRMMKADKSVLLDRIAKVKAFINRRFSNAQMREQQAEYLNFFVSKTDLKWSIIFGIMEASKQPLKIEEFAFRKISLEQAFSNLMMD
ncbi:ATP-binding cassette sub-family A member 2-like [Malaya genurostris]|uniref:ATP-binding cassette sub-family A member 2-like n=1 Tax=Malaya genurostris TaxID=325434 RepID=UPI0026F3AB2D|nr:ATP-binding cassette sub-family A member 2-like [Malaya genurostris]